MKEKKIKTNFGINLDKLLVVKKKTKEEVETKHEQELSEAKNQKERRQVKNTILEERHATEVEWVNHFVKNVKSH